MPLVRLISIINGNYILLFQQTSIVYHEWGNSIPNLSIVLIIESWNSFEEGAEIITSETFVIFFCEVIFSVGIGRHFLIRRGGVE